MQDNKQLYKFLPFLAMFYVTIMLTTTVFNNKIIILANHITMAGTLFIPLIFIISDVITEIYGYKIARNIVWLAFFCHFIFSALCNIVLKTSFPEFWHGQVSYEFVLGNQFRIISSAFIAYIISSMINIYLISKWKNLINGKYFWIRSLGASTIGEFIYTVIAVTIIQFNTLTLQQIGEIILTSYSIKVFCSIVLVFPASFIIGILKNIEILPASKPQVNPFKKTT